MSRKIGKKIGRIKAISNEHKIEELGMTGSTWKNAHGLPVQGHQSSPRDLAILFAAYERDFPDYFNLFRRIRIHAGLREVSNSPRRMLGLIKGIQGAKYGLLIKSRHFLFKSTSS